MSLIQRGPSAGVTGIISLSNGTTFKCKVYRWNPRLEGKLRQRRGRGGGRFATTRWMFSSGQVAITGQISPADAPAPNAWDQVNGTISVQIFVGKTISYPVTIMSHGYDYDEKKQDIPFITAAAQVTGVPTYTGWPNVPAITPPSKSDQQQWEGSSFAKDPKGLQGQATIVIDWWGTVADSDAGDTGKLDSVIAAAIAPYNTLKLRSAVFARDATDGGTITTSWGLTDTAEDVTNPATILEKDPNKIQTRGTTAALNNATPTIPSVAGQTLVERFTSKEKLNDGNTKYVVDFGQRSTVDDIEMDGTQAKIDLSRISSTGQDATVFPAGSSPPADAASPDTSLQVVARMIQDINLDEKKKITYFEPNTEIEKILFGRNRTTTDGFALASTKVIGAVYTTGSEPSAPGASGLVLIDKEAMTIISPNTSNLSATFWQYGEKTHADEVIFPRTETITDPNLIHSSAKTAALFTTGSPPSDPSAPTGLKLLDKADSPLTNSGASNQSIRVYSWGKVDSLDELKLPKQKTTVDANHIEDDSVRTKEWLTNSTPPAAPDDVPSNNVKLITYTDLSIYPVIGSTPGLYLRVFLYGAKDSRDELVLPNYETTTDASGLESTAIRAGLDGDTITDPSGFVLRDTKVRPVTLSLGTNRILTVQIYGLLSHADDEAYPRTVGTTDQVQGSTYTLATVEASDYTVTPDTFAATKHALYESDPTFRGIEARQHNRAYKVWLKKTANEDMMRHSASVHTLLDTFRGKPAAGFGNPAGWADPGAYVKVIAPGVVTGGPGGFLSGEVVPIYYQRNVGSFLVRRVFVTTTVRRPEDFYFLPQRGTVNSNPFLGNPAHQVMYVGPRPLYNGRLATNHVVIVDLEFRTDDLMFMNDGELPSFGKNYVWNLLFPISSSQYYAPAIFSPVPGLYVMGWPNASDFSSFGIT